MKLNELNKTLGSTHKRKIVGRGPGSGRGKTSGRGEKGQKSRSGSSIPVWFEGGQNPLIKRIPRRGFSNKRFATRYEVVNVEKLNIFDEGTTVTPELMLEKRLIGKKHNRIKVLGKGNLEKKLTIQANMFTNSAINKIEEMGGKVEVI